MLNSAFSELKVKGGGFRRIMKILILLSINCWSVGRMTFKYFKESQMHAQFLLFPFNSTLDPELSFVSLCVFKSRFPS